MNAIDMNTLNLRKLHRFCRVRGYTSKSFRAYVRTMAATDPYEDTRWTLAQVKAARALLGGA